MPQAIDIYLSPLRDTPQAQAAVVGLLILIVADVLFGVINAFLKGEFQSSKMREGLGHKFAYLGYVLAADVIDGTIIAGLDFGYSAPILTAACMYMMTMEIASLLETASKLNPDLGTLPVFKQFKINSEAEDE